MVWHPLMLFSLTMMVLGSAMALLSSFWLGLWLGLELNMMAFIPLFSLDKETDSGVSVKYFLVQSVASFMLLFSGLYHVQLKGVGVAMAMLAVATKMGSAPVFLWFPSVSEMMSLKMNALLMTLQKLAPLMVLFYLLETSLNYWLLVMIMMASALVGAKGGLNELSLRKLLSYSSINHLAWIMFGMLIGFSAWVLYYTIYCILIVMVLYMLHKSQTMSLNLTAKKVNGEWTTLLSLSLLSLGGLPPLLGFVPKWILMSSGSLQFTALVMTLLVLTSTVTLFYYMRASLSLFTEHTMKFYLAPMMNESSALSYYLMFNAVSIPAVLLVVWPIFKSLR